jgi:hypothetical protein
MEARIEESRMGRKEGNGVGQPGDQWRTRDNQGIGEIDCRMEKINGEKRGKWSGKAWRTRDKQGDWRDGG